MRAKNINQEAKILPLYDGAQSISSNGSFSCPAVALIHSLSAEVKLLKQIITQQKLNANTLIDNADLLREYKISRGTASNWRDDGLAHIKIGSKIFYAPEDVKRFLLTYYQKGFNIPNTSKQVINK
jgi:hypothetical protein